MLHVAFRKLLEIHKSENNEALIWRRISSSTLASVRNICTIEDIIRSAAQDPLSLSVSVS
jgi:hypothetical protein